MAIACGIELLLMVDVSNSMDSTEYGLQSDGYVAAFEDAAVQAKIASVPGGVAVCVVAWGGMSQQEVEVDWTLLTDATSCNTFAATLDTAFSTRAFTLGNTAPGSALNFSVPLFGTDYDGTLKIIDVSGDGAQNEGSSTSAARNNALAAGIDTINGLVILGQSGIEAFYTDHVLSPDGTLYVAADFTVFGDAILEKIVAEIGAPPSFPIPRTRRGRPC